MFTHDTFQWNLQFTADCQQLSFSETLGLKV